MDDPLLGLLDLPGVAEAVESARGSVDALLWDRAVGRAQQEVTAESALRGAWANAWFDGAEAGLPEMRSGAALDGSPIGRVLTGVVTMHAELPSLVAIVGTAPAQALARMHAIVARGFAPDAELGRPRSGEVVDDPLRLGGVASSAEVAERLSDLSQVLVASTAPGILVAAVAHAEIASLRPFGWGSGLVARALPRLLLAQRGVDPGMLGAPEVGLKAAGRPAYVRAVRGYAQGSSDGVAEMVRLVAAAVELGAQQPATWIEGDLRLALDPGSGRAAGGPPAARATAASGAICVLCEEWVPARATERANGPHGSLGLLHSGGAASMLSLSGPIDRTVGSSPPS